MSSWMTGQIVIRSSPEHTTRRQPLLAGPTTTPARTKKSNVGEVAGGTAADICVVCCCCPCVLLEFLILAVYKVPASMVRRIWRKKKKMKMKKKKGLLEHAMMRSGFSGEVAYFDEVSDVDWKEFEKVKVSVDGSAEAVELDKQMWDQFRNAGFWRSFSQRHDAVV